MTDETKEQNSKDCVFCKIIKGGIDSAKIWEDSDYLAILDVNPNTKGMTIVMPKEHCSSYIFDMTDEVLNKFLAAAKKVAKILEKSLNVKRVAFVMEGMGIDHAHIKLYPLHGLKNKFQEIWAKDKIFFDEYEGYLSTQLGPKKEMGELKKLAEEIKEK